MYISSSPYVDILHQEQRFIAYSVAHVMIVQSVSSRQDFAGRDIMRLAIQILYCGTSSDLFSQPTPKYIYLNAFQLF